MGHKIGDKVQFRNVSSKVIDPVVGTILDIAASGESYKVDFPGAMPMWYYERELVPFGGCFHEWREYDGFREKYEFCELCDAKKDLV